VVESIDYTLVQAPSNPIYGLVTVTGNVSDVDGNLTEVWVRRVEDGSELNCGITSQSSGTYQCEFTQPEGTYSYVVYAKDADGAQSANSDSITVTWVIPPESSCETSSLNDHITAGRAYDQYYSIYATGSAEYLGSTFMNGSDVVSLEETSSGYWVKVANCP